MSFLKSLLSDVRSAANVVTGHPQQSAGQAINNAHPAPAPDITYNPNPNTNIPYSTHDPNVARAAANPLVMRQLLNVVAPHLTADAGMTDVLRQGGEQNPGYTPLQGSVGVPHNNMQGGQDVYWQNTDGVQRNMVNPQVSDTGYYY